MDLEASCCRRFPLYEVRRTIAIEKLSKKNEMRQENLVTRRISGLIATHTKVRV